VKLTGPKHVDNNWEETLVPYLKAPPKHFPRDAEYKQEEYYFLVL